jgi:hypothetical protein
MSSTSIVCIACGADVAYGRLSCPECGELLASVAGGRRATVADVALDTAPASPDPATADVPGVPPVLRDVDPHDAALDRYSEGTGANGRYDLDDDDDGRVDLDDDGIEELADDQRWHDPVAAFNAAMATAPAALAPAAPPPGAYVPPVPSVYAATSTVQPAPARMWTGSNGTSNGSVGADHEADGDRDRAASVDPAKLEEFTGWLAVAGAALASVGFLLPWSNSVIGASGVGYFDRWGLAGPGHVILVLALLGTFVLALIKVPVPVWLRVGVPSLALGALLFGLVWPYVLGPLGAQPGVYAILVGALLLVIAGVTGIVGARHSGTSRSV